MAIKINNEDKNVRKVKINPFINNEGYFFKGIFLSSLIIQTYLIFISLYTSILRLEGYNWLQIEGFIETLHIKFFTIYVLNTIGTIDNLKELGFNFGLVKNVEDFGFNSYGYGLIILSVIGSILFNLIFFIQSYKQRKLKDCFINTYYEDWFIMFKNYRNNKRNIYYIKPLKMFKTLNDIQSKKIQSKLLKNYFKIEEELQKDYIIKMLDKKILFFYEYIQLIVVKIEKDEEGNITTKEPEEHKQKEDKKENIKEDENINFEEVGSF